MKRHLIFLFMGVSLVLLASCSLVDSEQGWTTISWSKPGEPSYSLQAKDNRYRILFEENASTRMYWYLNNYKPGLNLKMRTLNSKHLKNTVGGSAKQELSGKGYADFTMVYETSYKPQIERTYFKVHIEVNDKGDVDTKESSMTFDKTEKVDIKQE
jgi:putative lipoprotein